MCVCVYMQQRFITLDKSIQFCGSPYLMLLKIGIRTNHSRPTKFNTNIYF